MTPSRSDLIRTLGGWLPSALTSWGTAEFWADAAAEGVLPLTAAAVSGAGWPGVPAEVRGTVLRQLREEAARAELSDRDLRRVLGAFRQKGLPVLLLKGAALGYTHYGGSRNRPRLDVDLLIRREDIDRVHAAFGGLGAEYVPHVSGQYVMSQFHYTTIDAAGCRHAYDVHWRIVNGHRFANALTFDDVSAGAMAPPALASIGARVPSAVHALLLACVHRAVHHGGLGPLIWLYDVHILAERLGPDERKAVVSVAADRRLAGIVARSLADATVFGGGETAALACALRARSGDGLNVGRYLASRRNRARALVDDLGALNGWRPRAALLREVLFPPAAYMRSGYAPGSSAPLAFLYLHRALRGASGFFGRKEGRVRTPL
jgi:hypothetical protein